MSYEPKINPAAVLAGYVNGPVPTGADALKSVAAMTGYLSGGASQPAPDQSQKKQ